MVGPIEVLNTCRDKWKTFEFLKAKNLPVAASSLPEDCENFTSEFPFPIVVKPREVFSSFHFYLTNSKEEINYAVSKIMKTGWHPFLQEYLLMKMKIMQNSLLV